MKRNKLWVFEIAIILVSFFIFSNRFSPAVSSDDALTTLMTYDYSFPEAIYCWGQDRGGTIVPLIAQFFLKVFSFSAVWSESLARYLILILGFLSFRRFLTSNWSKLIFAVVFFLPPNYYTGFTIYSWGLMYSFVGVCIWLSEIYLKATNKRKILPAIAALLMAFIAIWTMDQAIIPLSILLAYLFCKKLKKENNIKWIYKSSGFYTSIIGAVAILFIILKLKEMAVVPSYYSYSKVWLNDWEGIKETFRIISESIQNELSFTKKIPLASIYYIGLLVSIPLGIYFLYKTKKLAFLFVFICCLTIAAMNISSKWVLTNYVSGRYFSGLYFIWSALFLLLIDQYVIKKKAIEIVLLAITIMASYRTFMHYKLIEGPQFESRYSELEPIEELGPVGIIGSYWYTYGISFRNPELIKATPHDREETKNKKLIDDVFAQPKIYLVKESWFEQFPDEITQFGRKLKKVGPELTFPRNTLNQYELIQ